MTTQPQHRDDFRTEDDIDTVLGYANPNPERLGCPSRDVLTELAGRQRAIGDPGYEHIVNCSPCYREFRSLQQAGSLAPLLSRRRAWWLSTAAAALVLAAVGAWYLVAASHQNSAREHSDVGLKAVELPANVDLRKYTVTRSEQAGTERQAVALPRGNVRMTIFLPVGSQPGAYEVQLLDADLRSRAEASGRAEIRDYITTLEALMDVHLLTPGTYQLAVRRVGEEWQLFPARVE